MIGCIDINFHTDNQGTHMNDLGDHFTFLQAPSSAQNLNMSNALVTGTALVQLVERLIQ